MAKLHKQQKRTIGECESCHERAPMPSRGLCYRCYLREERATERDEALGDPESPESRRMRKHLLRTFQSLMVALAELGAEDTLVLGIREQLKSYFAQIAPFVGYAANPSDEEDEVNSEHEKTFTSGKKKKSKSKNSDRRTVEEETTEDEDEDEDGADDEEQDEDEGGADDESEE